MFDFLKSLVPAKAELDKTIAKDAIAEMLRTSPEKLAEFEASYKKHALDVDDINRALLAQLANVAA